MKLILAALLALASCAPFNAGTPYVPTIANYNDTPGGPIAGKGKHRNVAVSFPSVQFYNGSGLPVTTRKFKTR